MKGLPFILVCFTLILATSVCLAYERRVGLGVSGGGALLSGADEERAELGPMGRITVRRGLNEHFGLGLNVSYGWNYDKDVKSFRTNLIPLELACFYTVMPEAQVSPYLTAGIGILRWDSNYRPRGEVIERERDPAFSIGGGFEIFIKEYLALDVGAKFHYMLTDDKDFIGRSAYNGPASNDHYLWYFGVGLTWYPAKPKDTDGDGVPDKKDKCPDTPHGAIVDEVGCPRDSDGDAVYDGLDKCPDTPKGAVVDSRGCPKDSDHDGVYDGIDKCPDTPRGARVDKKGCPVDSDGDGVYDGLDKCPDTPKGVEVDENGCPKKPDLSEVENILFQFDKADVIPVPNAALDRVVEILKAYPTARIEIQGHTDSIGSESYNMKLGLKRAEAVKKYLVDHGISADRLETKSFGETKPIAPNDTKEGRAKNRRVEFKLIE